MGWDAFVSGARATSYRTGFGKSLANFFPKCGVAKDLHNTVSQLPYQLNMHM